MQQTWDAKETGRLDSIITKEAALKSRVQAQKLIEGGHVRLNKRTVRKPSHTVSVGDTLMVDVPEEVVKDERIEAHDIALPVLFEDDACMVVNKPAGYSVHPAATLRGAPTILHGALTLFQERKLSFSPAEVLVHRLDKDTTGCLLLAKTPKAHLALQKQFADRAVSKMYLAIVAGIPEKKNAIIDASIGRDTTHRTRMSVHRASKARTAKTTYSVLSSTHDASLLQCELHTGRTHQIRVHLKTIGHPVLGDTTYDSPASRIVAKNYEISQVCLHAWKLGFCSPGSQKNIDVEAPLPSAFVQVLTNLGLTY